MPELAVRETEIKGLYEISLDIRGDERGSFREVFQAAKLEALGLPSLGPVQWNIAENNRRGTLRGIHAEPWDKYVHMISGEAFAAIVDVRAESPTFGRVCTFTLGPGNALFLSRGLGNSYQVTSDGGVYGYLVNQHWSPDATYTLVSFRDPDLAIDWPLEPTDVSDKDLGHPPLRELFPGAFSSLEGQNQTAGSLSQREEQPTRRTDPTLHRGGQGTRVNGGGQRLRASIRINVPVTEDLSNR